MRKPAQRGYPIVCHLNVDATECPGCLVPRAHGDTIDIVCNECAKVFATVDPANVQKVLSGLHPRFLMGRTCTIYYRNRNGELVAGNVTSANTVFEVARITLDWWASWGGKQPTDNTILEIRTVGNYEKCYYVRVGRVRTGADPHKPRVCRTDSPEEPLQSSL